MDLHQLQVTHRQEQDRLLLRATFRKPDEPLQEVRAWLTRRILVRLWPGILRALETKVTLEQPQAQHAKREIVGMAHQASISDNQQRGNFSKQFEDNATAWPMGEEPILVHTANFHLAANRPVRIEFVGLDGKRFEIAFAEHILHGFCKLLQDGARKAEWGVDLAMPGMAAEAERPAVLN